MSGPFSTITQDNVLQAFHHAIGLQSEGRLAQAAELWGRIATAAPRSAEARFNLGASLFDLERFEEAEAALSQAVALKPDAAWTHLRLANVLHATGKWREAEAAYAKALELDPNSHRAQLD